MKKNYKERHLLSNLCPPHACVSLPHAPTHIQTHTYTYRKETICSSVSFRMICIPSVLLSISEENLIIKWFSISGNVLSLKSVYLTVMLL